MNEGGQATQALPQGIAGSACMSCISAHSPVSDTQKNPKAKEKKKKKVLVSCVEISFQVWGEVV